MSITLASLRSLKQKKEAISKAAALQSGRAQVPVPPNEHLGDTYPAQMKVLEGLPGQFASLKLQMDQAPDYLATLADFERRLTKVEKSESDMKQEFSDNSTQLQQNKIEVRKLNEDMKFLSRGFEIFDTFKKEQETLKISSKLDKVSRELEDLKQEQSKLNIASRIEQMSREIRALKHNESETFSHTKKNTDAIRNCIGLRPEDYVDFKDRTLVARVDWLTATLKDHEKLHTEQLKKTEKQEKLVATVGQIQNFQKGQANLWIEHKKLSTRQDTNESRIKVLEDNNVAASTQSSATFKAEVKDLNDNIQAKIGQVEQHLSTLDNQFSALHIDEIKDNFQALTRTTAQLAQQYSLVEGLPEQITSLDIQIGRAEQRLQDIEQRTTTPDGPTIQAPFPVQPHSGPDAGEVRIQSLEGQVQTLQCDVQEIFGDLKNQLSEKAPTAHVDEALNNLRAVFRGFQDQYNNITTEDLYAKMVHWFLENYPSNTAQALQQLTALQHEIRGAQSTFRDMAWLQSKLQELELLVRTVPELSALVQVADGTRFKVDEIERLLNGVDVQSLPIAVRDMQQALRDLRSNSASFVTRRDIPQIKEDVKNEIKTNYTSISNRDRMDVDASVLELNNRVQSLENASSSLPVDLQEQIDKLKTNAKGFQEVEIIYPSLLKAVTELQSIIYNIHQNWPPDAEPFDCVIKFDFNRMLPAQQQANSRSRSAN